MSKSLAIGLTIGATLGSSYSAAMGGAYRSLEQISAAIDGLNGTKLEIAEFKKLSKDAQGNSARLRELAASLQRAGVDVRDLDTSSRRLNSTLLNLKKQSSVRIKIDANRQALGEARSSLVGIAASMYSIGKLVSARGDVLKAQGEIASLGIDDSGIDSITRVGEAFSNAWAGTSVSDFVRASYDVKSGISSLGDVAVGEFTRIAALTAAATKSTTAEMTNLFAKGYGIYRDQFNSFGEQVITGWQSLSAEERDIEFGKYFSAGISASVQAFRTDGAQMSQALSSLGATATTAGYAFSEQLAVLGELQRTMSGSEAATKFKAFLASASGAGEKLGLDFVNEQTGMLKSVPEILDQINDAYGGVMDQAAKDDLRAAFGTKEATELVDLLLAQRGALRDGAAEIEKSLTGGLEKTEEMAKRMQRGRGFELLGQQMQNLSAAVGTTLYPAAEAVAGAIGKVAVGLQWLSEKFPRTTGTTVGLVVGLIGVLAAAKALTVGVLWLKGGWLGMQAAYYATLAASPKLALAMAWVGKSLHFATLKTWALAAAQKAWAIGSAIVTAATTAIATGFRVMGLAVMSNPIGLAIAGIALAAGLVIAYWEPIKGFFSGLWDGIKSLFKDGVGFLISIWEKSPLGLLFKAGEKLTGFVGGLFGGDKNKEEQPPEDEPPEKEKRGFFGRTRKTAATVALGTTLAAPVAAMPPEIAAEGADSRSEISETTTAPQALASVRPVVEPVVAAAGAPDSLSEMSDIQMATPPPPREQVINHNERYEIVINATPGMDAKEIAAEVERQLKERERSQAARQRGALYD